jgi:hypothetical protein
LDEFVKRTLLDITNSVYEARKTSHLAIAPGIIEGASIVEPQMVNFEVAVTTSKDGGGAISVWSIADATGQLSSEHFNKISFCVPVYFQAKNPLKEE